VDTRNIFYRGGWGLEAGSKGNSSRNLSSQLSVTILQISFWLLSKHINKCEHRTYFRFLLFGSEPIYLEFFSVSFSYYWIRSRYDLPYWVL